MNIEINELATLLGGTQKQGRPPITGPQQIVVLDPRDGYLSEMRDTSTVGSRLTTRGASEFGAQLAALGNWPRLVRPSKPKLDPCGSIIAPDHAVILIIPCKSQW
jgi:hypothetical protein